MRLTSIALLLLATPVLAEINVPAEIQSPPNPIVATVDAEIPDGAQSKGKWEITGDAEAQLIEDGDHQVYAWAQPGTYTISYTGMWVDFEAKAFDFIDEEASLTVTAKDSPDPPPPPPPPPPGAKQMVLFYQAQRLDNLPQEQRQLLTSLVVHKRLAELGHVVRAVLTSESIRDNPPADYERFVQAVAGEPLPQIAIAPKDGGTVEGHPLPADYESLVKLLGGE